MLGLVIESPRLTLMAVSEVYAKAIFHEFTGEITEFMGPKSPDVMEETLAFIHDSRARMERGEEFAAAVLLKESGEYLGNAGLHHLDGKTPELGIWIKKGAQRSGYGREAVTALADWAFENLDVTYLRYPVDRRNIPSRRISESLNGVIEAEYEWTNYSGRVLDLLEYRIYPRS